MTDYKKIYNHVYDNNPYYPSAGQKHLIKHFSKIFPTKGTHLDVGCGRGEAVLYAEFTLGFNSSGIDVIDYNKTDLPLPMYHHSWDTVKPVEYLTCTDVLEHIAKEDLDEFLKNIDKNFTKKAFFTIAHFSHVLRGVELHLTSEPGGFWLDKICNVISCSELKTKPLEGQLTAWEITK